MKIKFNYIKVITLISIFSAMVLTSVVVADSGIVWSSEEVSCVNRSSCPYNEATKEFHQHTWMSDAPHVVYHGEHNYHHYEYAVYYCACD